MEMNKCANTRMQVTRTSTHPHPDINRDSFSHLHIILLLLFVSAAFSGCYYDNYSELYPNAKLANGCDTVSPVTYSKQISSLLNGYCVGCHSSSVANGSIILGNYSGAASAAESGKLYNSLLGQNGNPQMPPNSQLDACSIHEVELWIQNNYAQ